MRSRDRLLLAVVVISTIWQVPYGRQVLYPLSLLATYAHELGHGLVAIMAGAEFEQLLLYADGSGMAIWHGRTSAVATALIAAGGLAGPTIAGVALLLLTRSTRRVRLMLAALAVLVVLSVVLWSRNGFGLLFLLALATLLGLGARYLSDAGAAFILQLVAVTLCLSWFNHLDYMFSAQAIVGGAVHLSDSAIIADAFWFPYWFWGGLIAAFTLGLTTLGIWFASRDNPAAGPRSRHTVGGG